MKREKKKNDPRSERGKQQVDRGYEDSEKETHRELTKVEKNTWILRVFELRDEIKERRERRLRKKEKKGGVVSNECVALSL